MPSSSNDAIASYFDELFTDNASVANGRVDTTPAAAPVAFAEPAATMVVADLNAELKTLQESKKRQLQTLLNSQLLGALTEKTQTTVEHAAKPTQPAAVAEQQPLEPVVDVAKPHVCGKIRQEYLAWAENGRPVWAQNRFDALLFEVAGLTLAVPLIALGQIYRLTDQLSPVFGQIEWFMGFQPTTAGAVRTVDTAKLVMPERHRPASAQAAKFVVTIDGLDWGLAVDAVRHPISLQPDDVTWRSQRSKRPWLAGTVKSAMCALIDIPQLGMVLECSDRNRNTEQ